MLGVKLVVSDRSKPGIDDRSGLVLSVGYFEDACDGIIESEGLE